MDSTLYQSGKTSRRNNGGRSLTDHYAERVVHHIIKWVVSNVGPGQHIQI
jgi:hypothetical protein